MTWIGDHPPRHVHVYRDDRLLVKWDLERGGPMAGQASAKIRRLIRALIDEGLL